MKRPIIFFITLLIITILPAFCSPAQLVSQVTVSVTPTLDMPTIMSSNTSSPEATHTSPPSITPQSPLPTFPSRPTLAIDDGQAEIIKMLKGVSGCLLPCWWGVVPGQTSRSYITALMRYLNLEWSTFELPEGMEYESSFLTEGDFTQGTVAFTVVDEIVEDIHVHGDGVYDPMFADRWANYSLSEILQSYGSPSRIWVILAEGGEVGLTKNSYHLFVFYDEMKALFMYAGSSTSNAICPDFKNEEVDSLDIYLQVPNQSRKLTDITKVSGIIELLDQPDIYKVEKLTNSRIDDFYNLFAQNESSACFVISSN